MKWKMNKNNNKTVNHPPAADAAAAELPAATWSRNHSGKLLHYYIRQIKHEKYYLKWSDPISAQLCMTIRCNLRRVRTSVHLNHNFQPKTNPSLNKNQYLKNPAFQSPKNPVTLYPSFLNSKKQNKKKHQSLILRTMLVKQSPIKNDHFYWGSQQLTPQRLVNALTARRQKKIPTLRYANANHPPPYPVPHIFEECWPDNWDEIVLTNADERIEKTRNDTARLVKSDLNFHLFFQTLLSLLQKIRNLSKIALFSLKRHHPLHPSASSCSAKKN